MLWINLHVAPLSAIISDSLLRPFSHCCCCYCWCWQTMRCFCFWKGFSLTVVEWGSSRRGRQREKCYKNSSDGGIFSCACVKASSFRCACQSSARRMFAHVSASVRGKGGKPKLCAVFVCLRFIANSQKFVNKQIYTQTNTQSHRQTHTHIETETKTQSERRQAELESPLCLSLQCTVARSVSSASAYFARSFFVLSSWRLKLIFTYIWVWVLPAFWIIYECRQTDSLCTLKDNEKNLKFVW